MIYRKLIITIICLFACCFLGCNKTSDNVSGDTKPVNAPTLTVQFNKTEYVLGEPIIASISVTNGSNTPFYANWLSFGGGFGLRLEKKDGTRVELIQLLSEAEHPMFRFEEPLKHLQSYTTAFDLVRLDVSGSSAFFPRLSLYPSLGTDKIRGYVVEPGTFKIKVIQALTARLNPPGSATALDAYATFTIREPNDREKEALKLFELQPILVGKSADEARKADAEQSQLGCIAAYDKIWNSYRDTVYAPYALYYAARVSQKMGDNAGAVNRYTTLQESAKDFPLMADLLYHKTIALRDSGKKEEAATAAQTLKEKYWNHMAAPTIEYEQRGSRIRNLISELGIQ